MDRFIKIACDDDYSQLFIKESDYVLTPEVYKVWDKIYEEFLDGMKDQAGIQKQRLIGKINYLQYVYELIQLCVKFLSESYHPDVVRNLSKHVRVGDFNPEDMESYFRDLQVVLNRAQRLQVEIEEKKAELAIAYGVTENDEKPVVKPNRKQYDHLITMVSIYAKFHIDKKSVTVSEFTEYFTASRENIEAMEEAYAKQNNKR